ncbi:hypothetical protein GCM10009680_87110 [Streptomyces yatensis]|uniref:Uncharacterized protein n=1 Tax=Streptomyces yatensis TaxID=155177 RepID=A0ABN2JN83_9ACTN
MVMPVRSPYCSRTRGSGARPPTMGVTRASSQARTEDRKPVPGRWSERVAIAPRGDRGFATVPVWVPPAVFAVVGKMGRPEPDSRGELRA